jgi:hypothetical protein
MKKLWPGSEEMNKAPMTYMVPDRKSDRNLAETATAPRTAETMSSGMLSKLASESATHVLRLLIAIGGNREKMCKWLLNCTNHVFVLVADSFFLLTVQNLGLMGNHGFFHFAG